MNSYRSAKNQRGITLIAVVMVVLAIGLIAYFAGAIAVKLQQIATERNTVNRMTVVRTALEQYYQAHQNLPDPTTTTATYTPTYSVAVGELQLEQKFRVDAWGQLYHYNRTSIPTPLPGSCPQPGTAPLNPLGLTVENNLVAAVIVSAGPNQIFDSFDPTSPPTTYPESGFSKNDDVYVAINLSQQAQKIAREELGTLAKKVWAYDCTCPNSPMPLTLAQLITQFSLGDEFYRDPWGACYDQDVTGIMPRFVSPGPDGDINTLDDNVVVPQLGKCCKKTPPGGNTLPLHYWDFNTTGDTGVIPVGDVTPETSGTNTALNFNATASPPTGYALAGGSFPAEYLFNFERTTPFSIVAWIKTGADGTILSKMTSATPRKGYRVYISGGLVYFELCSVDDDNNSYTIRARGSTTITDGNCHHIAVTYDYIPDSDGFSKNDGLTIYVDGADVTNQRTGAPLQGSIKNAVPFQISGYDGANDLFTGIVDDVAIYDVVLDAVEINNIWDGTDSTDPADPLNDNEPEWEFCDFCLAASYWKFDGDLIDSADGNDGACGGLTSCTYGTGRISQALQLSGSAGSYVRTGVSGLTGINSAGAISLWVRPTSLSGGGTKYLFDGSGSGGSGSLSISVPNSNVLRVNVGNSGNVSTGQTIVAGSWYHIVLSWNGGTFRVYVNNVLVVAAGSYSQFSSIGSRLYFGSNNSGGSRFNGRIDDAAVFTTTLSTTQISTFYNGGSGSPVCP